MFAQGYRQFAAAMAAVDALSGEQGLRAMAHRAMAFMVEEPARYSLMFNMRRRDYLNTNMSRKMKTMLKSRLLVTIRNSAPFMCAGYPVAGSLGTFWCRCSVPRWNYSKLHLLHTLR